MYWHSWGLPKKFYEYAKLGHNKQADQNSYINSVWSPHPPGQPTAGGFLVNGRKFYTTLEEDRGGRLVITKDNKQQTDMEIEVVNYADQEMKVVLIDGAGVSHDLGPIAADGGELRKTVVA